MSFAPVRLDGGGCANVHALNAAKDKLVCGADTQGFYLTTTSTLGNKWSVQNTGIGKQVKYRQCAAIMWSATETSPAVIYAGTGDKGSGGGLLAGTLGSNGIITWALRSAAPQWCGNQVGNSGPPALPNQGWQRSTGRLLLQTSLFLFAGTYQQGVLRSSNTGGSGVAGSDDFPVAVTMASAAPGTGNWFCRALAQDPNTATTIWASFYDSTGVSAGLWKCTNAHAGSPNFTAVSMTSGPTAAVEDIYPVGDFLYVAAANDGLYRYGPLSGSPVWTSLNGASVPTGTQADNWWMTIAGFVDGSGNHVLVAGDSNPAQGGGLAKTLMQLSIPSTWPGSGSITYTSLTGSVQVTNVPTPSGSYTWWMPAANLHAHLGGAGYICPMVTVDATVPASPKWYCAGSGGAFRSIGSATAWTVSNSGMPMFLGHPVAANPVRAGHLVWGDSDWCLFDDTNPGAETASSLTNDPPIRSTEGWAVAISADGNTVYGSQGAKYTNSAGEVWSRPWNQTAAWTSMGFKARVGGQVAIGMAAFNDGANPPNQIVLAAVWGSGLWRYDGANWSNRNATIAAQGSAGNQIPVTYYGNGLCYVYDSKTGIWRSNNYGVSWTLIWAKTSNDYQSRTVAYDVTRPGRLWVSAAGLLYKLGNADAGTVAGGTITGAGSDVTPAGKVAGCLGTDGAGNVFFATQDTGSGSGLLKTSNDGVAWADITGADGSFGQCNCNPEFMAVGPVEPAAGAPRIYVSGSNVVAQGFPAGSAPAGVSSPFTEVQVNANLAGVNGVLPMWFGAGGAGSTRGNLLIARVETTDGSATITPSDPGWQLASDVPAAAGAGTTRVLTYWYPNNPGGIGGQGMALIARRPSHPAPVLVPAGRALVTAGVTAGGAAAPAGLAQSSAVIAGTIVPANTATFTSSNTSAAIKGKLAEYSSGNGTIQYLDQTGSASATSSATSLPVTATAANTYTGGLGIAHFAAAWSPQPTGQTWTAPGGWTQDGVGNNTALSFSMYYQAGLGAGPTSVTGTINPGSGGTITSWAAQVTTYYALAATPVSIGTTSLPNGTTNVAYSQALTASGGATPYSWAVTSGSLPTGLSLSAGGAITGTPSVAGTYNFSVTVTDSATQTATTAFTVTIVSALSITTTTLPNGTVGVNYTAGTLVAVGGTLPYSWAIVAGALPPGLGFPLITGSQSITGVPLLAGTFNFTAQVTDHLGATATQALSITVTGGPLVIQTTAMPPGRLGQPYAAQFVASGGTGTYHWAITSGSLPPGLALADNGAVTGTLLASGAYPFTVQVTDS